MKKLLIIGAVVSVALTNIVSACTKITGSFDKLGIYTVRDMELCGELKTRLAVYPRGLAESGMVLDAHPLRWISKYGFIVTEETNLHNAEADGMNEKGLGAHFLFMDGAQLPERDLSIPGLNALFWVRYLLENYATVNEVIADLNNYQIVSYPIPFHEVVINFPFHITVEDTTGDIAILEFVKKKLVVYHGKQYKVMTNDPPYNLQVKNLAEVIKQGYYTNNLLPGGADSKNRFVRASYFSQTLPPSASPKDAVSYMFSAIAGVIAPYYKGYQNCTFANVGGSNIIIDDVWPSQYQTALDHTHRIYYYSNMRIGNRLSIDLNKFNLNAGQPTKILDPNDPTLVGDVSNKFIDAVSNAASPSVLKAI